MTDAKQGRPGRPRKVPADEKRTNFTFRLPQAMREHLIASSEQKGRSLGEEIEWRLAETMEVDDRFGGSETAAIGRMVATAITAAMRGKSWHDDEETRLRCRKTAVDVVNVLMGGLPNRLLVASGDPEEYAMLKRAEDEAREISTAVIHDEIKRLAARPPVVKPLPIERVREEVESFSAE